MAEGRALRGVWLGTRPYRPVLDLQNRLREAVDEGAADFTVLLLEHPLVVTLGKAAQAENVLLPEPMLRDRGVDVVRTDRGGDVTLHAPGQLVAYPIVSLRRRKDVRWYVRTLTEVMRRLLVPHGVASGEAEGMVGLWVDRAEPGRWEGAPRARDAAKIGAIGVRISRWVTMHGFALNLTTDLSAFEWIVPCGLHGYPVTSLRQLTGVEVASREAASEAFRILAELLEVDPGELEDASARPLDEI